jgi:hypothetical protein
MEFDVSVLQACLSHSLLGPLDHLMREIYSDYSPLRSDFVSSQNNVYPASATEIYNHVSRLKVRETGGVATTPREVESNLWHQGKLLLAI